MNKKDFCNIKNIELLLLKKLNIIKEKNYIYEISNYPDFDLTIYDKHNIKNYFFQNTKSFENDYLTVLEANISYSKMLHSDNLQEIKKKYPDFDNFENNEMYLSNISNIDEEFLEQCGYEMLNNRVFERLSFNKLDLKILNNSKEFLFSGSYEAENSGIEPMDIYFFVQCKVLGISFDIEQGEFYKELLAEVYKFYLEGTYKIAYFLLFSAFESYINYKLQSHDEQKRLSEKINELFKNTFKDISKHQIYTSFICEFKCFETNRNTIAHGKESISIDQEGVSKVLIFVMVFINSIEHSISTFEELI